MARQPRSRWKFQLTAARRRLEAISTLVLYTHHFNSQPREGGWIQPGAVLAGHLFISTHSRAKAAGPDDLAEPEGLGISTHSRAKAAGKVNRTIMAVMLISTHSRAKAAGCMAAWVHKPA